MHANYNALILVVQCHRSEGGRTPERTPMGQLIYSMIVSQDGFVADRDGDFTWGQPAEDALASVNEEMVNVGTYLYGRRMYDIMAVWETDPAVAAQSPGSQVFADLWRRADKVVYSTSLEQPYTTRTRLEREFDPAVVRELKVASSHDLTVDGPTLAAHALRHGLVDRVSLLVCPIVVGGGLSFWPEDVRLDLRLRDLRQFEGGVVRVSYDVTPI